MSNPGTWLGGPPRLCIGATARSGMREPSRGHPPTGARLSTGGFTNPCLAALRVEGFSIRMFVYVSSIQFQSKCSFKTHRGSRREIDLCPNLMTAVPSAFTPSPSPVVLSTALISDGGRDRHHPLIGNVILSDGMDPALASAVRVQRMPPPRLVARRFQNHSL